MIDIKPSLSDYVSSKPSSRNSWKSDSSSSKQPDWQASGEADLQRVLVVGTRPKFQIVWMDDPHTAGQQLLELGLRSQVAMLYLASGQQSYGLEDLVRSQPGLSQLVICGDEATGQEWLPTPAAQADLFDETHCFSGGEQVVHITRAFSLTSGLYSAGALAIKLRSDLAATIFVPGGISLETLLPEIDAVTAAL